MFGSKRHFNGWNFFICWLVSLGQIAFGYPASIIGTTLAQPSFLVYMKLVDPTAGTLTENADQLIGATSGVFQVCYLKCLRAYHLADLIQAGAFFNVFIAGWVSDRWGRKAGFLWCSLLSLLGGAILCGSRNIAMFVVARFIAGGGSWGFLSVSKLATSSVMMAAYLTRLPSTNIFS